MNEEQVKADIQELLDKLDALGVNAAIVSVDLGETYGLRMLGSSHDLMQLTYYSANQVTEAIAEHEGLSKEQAVMRFLDVPAEVINEVKGLRRHQPGGNGGGNNKLAGPSLTEELTKSVKF